MLESSILGTTMNIRRLDSFYRINNGKLRLVTMSVCVCVCVCVLGQLSYTVIVLNSCEVPISLFLFPSVYVYCAYMRKHTRTHTHTHTHARYEHSHIMGIMSSIHLVIVCCLPDHVHVNSHAYILTYVRSCTPEAPCLMCVHMAVVHTVAVTFWMKCSETSLFGTPLGRPKVFWLVKVCFILVVVLYTFLCSWYRPQYILIMHDILISAVVLYTFLCSWYMLTIASCLFHDCP